MEQLIRQRAVVKRRLTTFTNVLNDFQSNLDNGTLDDVSIISLQKRLSEIQNILEKFEEIQIQIDIAAETVEIDCTEREEFEKKFFTAIATAEHLLSLSRPKTPPVQSIDGSSQVSHDSVRNQNISSRSGIVLPAIHLPKFSGKSHQWLEFRDLFISLVDSNSHLDDIQKFHYLRASLEADAAHVIKSIKFCARNYLIAWQAMLERYNSPKVLLHNHIKNLFNMEAINKRSSVKIRGMLDNVSENLKSVLECVSTETLGDTLIIHLMTSKLDTITMSEWEDNIKNKQLPSLDDLTEFLKAKADLLEILESKQNSNADKYKPSKCPTRSFVVTNQPSCILCKASHALWMCEKFLELSQVERLEKVKQLKLCILCLKKGHYISKCRSKYACSVCKKRHNLLLHEDKVAPEQSHADTQEVHSVNAFSSNLIQVFLPTASIKVIGPDGQICTVRALLDSGSQSNFITQQLCDKLKLKTTETDVVILGIGHSTSKVQLKCKVQICSQNNNYKMSISSLVVNKITSSLPACRVNLNELKIPTKYNLADPLFYKPDDIDILLGANEFWDLLSPGQYKLGTGLPVLQNSKFGWLISGPIPTRFFMKEISCNFSKIDNIQRQLAKFWELENVPENRKFSPEERACEEHYVSNTVRDSEGRFIVTYPLKESIELLAESREQAMKRFLNLENKLNKNKPMKEMYSKFMAEYIDLNHMTETIPKENEISYYLPHHGVMKEDSLTTKLRVVFDGSAQTSSGYSFNDLQMVGATIQSDLFSLLIRFRYGQYAISADIEKMYRMVLIKDEQRSLQRILWRSDPNQPIKDYNLNTVTYGTASGPFLAIRSLFQIALECEASHPVISNVIKNNFYVDDLLYSTNDLKQAKYVCEMMPKILASGCFKLRKWLSNNPDLLSNFLDSDKHPNLLQFGSHENTKTLGLVWDDRSDCLMYSIIQSLNSVITKRTILSEASQIFDPLGLLCASIIVAKMLLQDLWRQKLDWDEPLPSKLQERWLKFKEDLSVLNDLKIPRRAVCADGGDLELHAFSDASTNAYGACIFIRAVDQDRKVSVNLLCAKGKVAPIKQQTIPRLELLGALTAAKIVEQVRKQNEFKSTSCVFWCDSTIVLGWLKSSPSSLQTFVANRIAEIQELTQSDTWRHVPTKFNPADLVSRGVYPSELLKSQLWWHGPSWLSKGQEDWPVLNYVVPDALPEVKNVVACVAINNDHCSDCFDFNKFSDLSKLERITAYCLRFKYNCIKPKSDRRVGVLTPIEINSALMCLVKRAQYEAFNRELKEITQKKLVHVNSHVQALNPFLDADGFIRVGGRLSNSDFDYEKCHPILLSGKHRLTKLIFSREHLRLCHAGPQHLLASVREKFWPTSGRDVARQVVRQCAKCFRVSPRFINPIMGDLPASRIKIAPPFTTVGVDYAGPLLIKDRKGRGCKTSKCYICIFVCFTTKAIHLELVSSLSTESFILSLRRFVSRRGKPSHIHSDNGLNFVGADSELKELSTFLVSNETNIAESCAAEGITWHFIPPHSPHFGGLWESGVRSCKFHLKRIVGNTILMFEEMYSLLVQIEAILNSRPLSPLSSDPNDLNPLTPAHFLVGKNLMSIPDPDVRAIPEPRLSLYQKIQQMQQHFWNRWSKEYVAELQQRTKWKKPFGELQPGTMVLIKEDNQPPMRWKLGKIVTVHPGQDGVNRVATIKTSSGEVKRGFAKICPLPITE